ncbi:MAG: hypothetical protein IJ666_03930 [Ruminococcus sp.]|nr:hypothetical protein [Ruminococcus sp.]
MSPKTMGRPPIENPKNSRIAFRIDKETLAKLEFCVKENNSNFSEIIRQGIEIVYEKTKK